MALIQHLKPHNPTAPAAGKFLQYAYQESWGGTGVKFTFPTTIASGSLVLAGIYANSGTPTLTGGGTGWTQTDSQNSTFMFYGTGNGSGTEVTVNGSSQWAGVAANFSNVSGTMVAHAVAGGSGTSPSVSATATAAGQFAFAYLYTFGSKNTPSGWAEIGHDALLTQGWYRTTTGAGSLTASWTTSNAAWVALIAIFAP